MKYVVTFSAIADKSGNPRLKGETVDEADLADPARLIALEAIAPDADAPADPPASDPATTGADTTGGKKGK